MVGLEFDKDKMLPSLTLVELGNQAYAQSESGSDDDGSWLEDEQQDTIYKSEVSLGGIYKFVGAEADWKYDPISTHYSCGGFAIYCDYDEPYTELYR